MERTGTAVHPTGSCTFAYLDPTGDTCVTAVQLNRHDDAHKACINALKNIFKLQSKVVYELTLWSRRCWVKGSRCAGLLGKIRSGWQDTEGKDPRASNLRAG